MVDQGVEIAIRYLLLTSMMVVSAKVAFIMFKRFNNYAQRLNFKKKRPILVKLYKDVNAYVISINHRRDTEVKDEQFTYGEIIFSSFADILNVAKPNTGEKFYDLGCGSGKAVFTAGLLYDNIEAIGIEYLQPLYDLCLEQLNKYKQITKNKRPDNIHFVHADLVNYDFSDADIVFLNATCFNKDSWKAILTTLDKLKKGARVIITTKTLSSKKFEQIHAGTYLMSWGQNSIYIYKKT